MSDQWVKDIEIGALPEPFDQIIEAMEGDLLDVLPRSLQDLVPRIAHVCMLSILVECEGEDMYFPRLHGDKFCDLRHDLIRRDFKKFKKSEKNPMRAITKKFKISTRTARNILKGDHENQTEMFEEDG